MSQMSYAYGNGSPTMHIDPSGHTGLDFVMGAIIVATLVFLAVAYYKLNIAKDLGHKLANDKWPTPGKDPDAPQPGATREYLDYYYSITDPDQKNAYRHCFGTCYTATGYGEGFTVEVGALRELGASDPDALSDYCNNAVGASLGNKYAQGDFSGVYRDAQDYCSGVCNKLSSNLREVSDPNDGRLCARPPLHHIP
ncbi:MAG: hypothetical protein ACHREM_15125 [Polyangiales bacterium]